MSNQYPHIPIAAPRPDAGEFIDILMGRKPGARVPLVEYNIDDKIRRPVTENMLGRKWVQPDGSRESLEACLDNFIEFWRRMGYDFVRFESGMPLASHRLVAQSQDGPGARAWVDQHKGTITTWEEFEKYPWPTPRDFDFTCFDYINAHMPDGMGLMCCHCGGMLEHLSSIMSVEGLCVALCEDPPLVEAIAAKLGGLMTSFYEHLVQLDRLIAVFPGDDMGYKTSTMISPKALRTHTLPWHTKFAAMAHARGVPYFLHSCGQLSAIMDCLIDEVKIDGKHSYEDAIIPVEEFHARYGGRIAVLGGIDVNILSAGTQDDVRRRVRFLMETCGPRGRYAVGAGNSVPDYVPLDNYLAMVDEVNKGL